MPKMLQCNRYGLNECNAENKKGPALDTSTYAVPPNMIVLHHLQIFENFASKFFKFIPKLKLKFSKYPSNIFSWSGWRPDKRGGAEIQLRRLQNRKYRRI